MREQPHPEVVRVTKRLNAEHAASGDVQGARALIERSLLARGLCPSLVTANVLIKTYRTASMPEGGEAVLQELPAWGLQPDGCTFSTLVDAYGLVRRVNDAYRILYLAETCNAADSRVYSALLRFVPPEDVEGIMARVHNRGVPYDQSLCNAALNTLATAGRAAEAQAFVDRFAKVNDNRTHSLLIKAHCVAGDAHAADALLAELYRRGAQVVADHGP